MAGSIFPTLNFFTFSIFSPIPIISMPPTAVISAITISDSKEELRSQCNGSDKQTRQ